MSCPLTSEQILALHTLKKKLSLGAFSSLLSGGLESLLANTVMGKMFGQLGSTVTDITDLIKETEAAIAANLQALSNLRNDMEQQVRDAGKAQINTALDYLRKSSTRPTSLLFQLIQISNWLITLTNTLNDCAQQIEHGVDEDNQAWTTEDHFTRVQDLNSIVVTDGINPNLAQSVINVQSLQYSNKLISYLLSSGEVNPTISELIPLNTSNGTTTSRSV